MNQCFYIIDGQPCGKEAAHTTNNCDWLPLAPYTRRSYLCHEHALKAAYILFELGWTIPDVVEELGISYEDAEQVCHQYLKDDAETKYGFARMWAPGY